MHDTNSTIFYRRLQQYITIFDYFQIDICDGIFVDNKTIQIEELDVKGWRLEVGKSFELHLMVKTWQDEISKIDQLSQLINIKSILIHLQVFNPKYQIPNTKYSFGLVLNPEDDVTNNIELIKQFPICQIMTTHPGRQGNPFLPETLNKIDQLRQLGYQGKILFDGAINDKTLPIIMARQFLPDTVCPGSYFHDTPVENFTKIAI